MPRRPPGRVVSAAVVSRLVVSRAVVSRAVVSRAGAARRLRLSSSGLGSTDVTRMGVESGRIRTVTWLSAIRWPGARLWLSSIDALMLSTTVTSRMRGGVVSCTNVHSSPAAVFPGASRTVSNASRPSNCRLWFSSSTPRTRYSPSGSGPSLMWPLESATPR